MSGWCIDVISTCGHYHASLLVFLITSTQWRILLHLRKNSKVRLLYLVHNANGFTITWENVLWDMNCVRHADSKTSTLIKRDLFLHKTLTHQHLVPHICVSELIKHWFKKRLVACSAPRHYLNQSWVIVSWTLTNKLQWNSVNKAFHSWTCNWKSRLPNWRPFCPGGGGGGGGEIGRRNLHIQSRIWMTSSLRSTPSQYFSIGRSIIPGMWIHIYQLASTICLFHQNKVVNVGKNIFLLF